MNHDENATIDKENSTPIRANIIVLGGDMRAVAAAKKLTRRGHRVTLCGFSEADTFPRAAKLCPSFKKAAADADVLLLPMPVTRDGINIFCPLDRNPSVRLEDIDDRNLKKSTVVFGGNIPREFKSRLTASGFSVFDYLEDPSLALLNAHATAEGALMYAMEATSTTLFGRNIAILGYGRIAERLCRLCLSFGACVTVFARRDEARTQARLHGASVLPLTSEHAKTLSHGFDIIFNTVPSRIIPTETARSLSADTLYIELASSPFGIDVEDARHSSAKVIWAASVPGKYAPETAGEIIADVVLSQLDGLKVGGEGK